LDSRLQIPFDTLPESSRVWIYQANRSFTEEEQAEIKEKLQQFIEQWTAHGANLQASFEMRYRRFIILALDQKMNTATGCSIDDSVRFIQQLEKDYNVDLLDKMNVSYKQGEFVAYKTLTDFRKMAKDKAVSPKTIVFNNLVNNKAEYLSDWEVPASESWHKRFLN
jgi:DNA-binding transcriptional regulator YhcF (GntR family)